MSTRECQLIMVTENNNNKFYNMYDNGDSIRIEYGRVGAAVRTCSKPSHMWDKIYREKTGKGYKDVTSLKTKVEVKGYKEIEDSRVRSIVELLISRSKQQLANNYRVSYTEVSPRQIEEAQKILDELVNTYRSGATYTTLNSILIRLFTAIPRKMAHVNEHLFNSLEASQIDQRISKEQDLLDSMATQVNQNKILEGTDNDKTILEQIGLSMRQVVASNNETDRKTIEFIKRKLGKNADQLVRVFEVCNNETEKSFKEDTSCIDQTTHYYWHGSRTENWWSILSTGLKIRPSNAVYTGSMFGDGLYFADKAQKSLNYTSINNSYWARGNDLSGYLALYEVRVGKQKLVDRHTSECYKFNKDYLKEQDYDSVFAKAGVSLVNNEYIVYASQQCTVRYLVELGR